MKAKNLALLCLAFFFAVLLAGCGGGGGGGSTVSSGTSSDSSSGGGSNPQPTATPVPTASLKVNLQYGAAGKPAQKAADAATVGLPSNTANVLIHLVNPATNQDVVPPVQQAHKAGATEEIVTFSNVPYGSWVVIVQALAADNSVLGFYNGTVPVQSSEATVTVNSSVTLKSLAITPATATVNTGSSTQFTATGTFSDGSTSNMSSVAAWSSSVTNVASVDRGKCVGLQAGQSFIVALLADQNATGTLTVIQQVGPTPTPSVSPSPSPAASPTLVGTQVCAQCHTSGPYNNMYQAGQATDSNATSYTYMDLQAYGSIYNNYVASVHYTPNGTQLTDAVTCEGCHGPGSQHYGVGPIPYYMPSIAQCGPCHNAASPDSRLSATLDTIDLAGFNASMHANPSKSPDKFFFQTSNGTAQATSHGAALWADLAGTQPVTKNQRIEECGVCHTPDQKATHIASGDLQDPPQVGCASCHDPHNPAAASRNTVFTSGAVAVANPSQVVNLKPVQVNNNSAAAQFGAMNKNSGTWIRPREYFAYKTKADGSVDTTASFGGATAGYAMQGTAGDWVRVSGERLCAGCHASGQYKYTVASGSPGSTTPVTATHQNDVWGQFYLSGHYDAKLTGGTTGRFSLKASPSTSTRPWYPMDMGGRVGQDAYTADGRTVIAGTPKGWGGAATAPNIRCMRCHHGIATIDYQKGTQWGNAIGDKPGQAHILWADASKTCITCHDPHKSGTNTTKNVREPEFQSYHDIPVSTTSFNLAQNAGAFTPVNAPNGANGAANVRGGVKAMMDLSPVPSDMKNNANCAFCHQGRESGWTAWNSIRYFRKTFVSDTDQASKDFWYTNADDQIDPTGTGRWATMNNHDLPTAGIVWGRNADEYAGKQYDDGIPAHRTQGCVGCHMSNPDISNAADPVGGHTFNPNIKTCQTCHPGLSRFQDVNAKTDYDGSNFATVTVGQKFGTLTVIPVHVNGNAHVNVWGTAVGGTGLLQWINQALYDGIVVNLKAITINNVTTVFATSTPATPVHQVRIHIEMSASGTTWKAWAGQDLTTNTSYNKYVGSTLTDGGLKWIVTPRIQAMYQNVQHFISMCGGLTSGSFTAKTYAHNGIYFAQILIDTLEQLGKTTNPTTSAPFVRPGAADGGSLHDARNYRDPASYGGPNL